MGVVWVESLDDAFEQQLEVVGRLRPDDLERPSACDDWTVRMVLNHSIGVTRKFAAFAAGETREPHAPPGDLIGADHNAALRAAVGQARMAWSAVDLSRTCRLPFGTFTAEGAAGVNLFDVLAHTWDIAVVAAISLDDERELWAIGLDAARHAIGRARDFRQFGEEITVPETAPAMIRFLAFLGRTPT